MRFIEIINNHGYGEFINVNAIAAVGVRDRPPRVEVHIIGGGCFRQEYTDMQTALTGQDEILREVHGE